MFPKFIVRLNEFLDKLNLSSFSIFVVIGLVLMMFYIIKALEIKNGYSRERTNKLLIFFAVALAVTYVFATFFDALFHFFADGDFTLESITFIAGFLGGVISFVILIYFFMKDERKNILNILNIIIPGVVLAHAFGRIGCFSVGCCYGEETSSIFGVYFPDGTNPYFDGIYEPIHPTQLYESFFLFGLFFSLNYISKIKNFRFSIYLISYGSFRFILEKFFRGDSRGQLFGFPPSQILSVVMLILGVSLLIYIHLHQKKEIKVEEN